MRIPNSALLLASINACNCEDSRTIMSIIDYSSNGGGISIVIAFETRQIDFSILIRSWGLQQWSFWSPGQQRDGRDRACNHR